MSKESFARGFCKVAEAHGVDPVSLAKYAASSYEDAVRKSEQEGYKREQAFKPDLTPVVSGGKGRVDTAESGFSGLPAPGGNLSWLGSTKPTMVPISDGRKVYVPGGAASLTNNPDRLLRVEPGSKGGGTSWESVWDVGGPNKARRGDGRAVRYPNGALMQELLNYLSKTKQ